MAATCTDNFGGDQTTPRLGIPISDQYASPTPRQPQSKESRISAIRIATASGDSSSASLIAQSLSGQLPRPSASDKSTLGPFLNEPSAGRVMHCQLSSTEAVAVVCAAWALLVARAGNSDDSALNVIVGATFPVIGPIMAKLSVQIKLACTKTVSDYLKAVQHELDTYSRLQMIPDERDKPDPPGPLDSPAQLMIQLSRSDGSRNDPLEGSYFRNAQYALLFRAPSDIIKPWMVENLSRQVEFVIHQLLKAEPYEHISDIQMATPDDVQQLWTWNATVPETVDRFIHDIIQENAISQPDAPALCAWDGDVTYGELDKLSTKLAGTLVESGVKPGMLVPLCFEKSMWTTVAVLGVLKANGGIVLLDTSLPERRLEILVDNVKGHNMIVSSVSNQALSSRLAKKVVILDWALFSGLGDQLCQNTYNRPPAAESIAYVAFTSGSTGTPKGVAITHKNVTSALHHQLDPMGLNRVNSRLYDFSSYSFDVAAHNIFSALAAGACLCVPNDSDRKSRLEHSIVSLRANILDLTPSVARCLSREALPEVHTMVFSGEALRVADVEPWWNDTKVYNLYGPCECTPVSTINDAATTPEEVTHLGKGVGLNTWVVDPENHDSLLPPGYVGELLLEGPLIGQGYLNDPEKTAKAFIKDAAWLLQGAAGAAGRRGRLYKSGDLVRYNRDGSLSFVGRKDTQVKINGQRVELAEVEHQVQILMPAAMQVVAEPIQPQGSPNPMLVVFLELPGSKVNKLHSSDVDILAIPRDMEEDLSRHLPSYMVPTTFLSMSDLPMTPTGKADRRRLREIGALLSAREVAKARTKGNTVAKRPATSVVERCLRDIWAQVLNIDADEIGLDDSFFHLGGNSIAAMRVVGQARKAAGIKLTVADFFRNPVLDNLATQAIRVVDHKVEQEVPPFALLGDGVDITSLLTELSSAYHMNPTSIRDVYPCTPAQEGIMSLASQDLGSYIVQDILELASGVDVDDVCAAWARTARAMPVLRTKIIQHGDHGLLQIVSDEEIQWVDTTVELGAYLELDREKPMGLGEPLTRHAVVRDSTMNAIYVVFTIHHALYDGWSARIVADTVERAFRGETIHPGPQFQAFVKHLQDQDEEAMLRYWQSSLGDFESSLYPALPPAIDWPVADTLVHHKFSLYPQRSSNITIPTLVRGAWAIIAGRMANADDVLFGAIVSGRTTPVAGIEILAAPTFATVPIRIKLNGSQRVVDYLHTLQSQATDMMPFEQAGLHRLFRLSPEMLKACMFQTLLVIQPKEAVAKETTENSVKSPGNWQDRSQLHEFNSYALMIEVQLEEDSVLIKASFDSRVIEPWLVPKLLQRLEHVMAQLESANTELTLAEVSVMTQMDLRQIWDWNSVVPELVDQCVHDVVQSVISRQPSAQAICSWDGKLSYEELDKYSTHFASRLIAEHGVKHDMLVPLCFEKSMWAPVAMLAVLKAGAGFALLDPCLPDKRLQSIIQQLRTNCILTSFSNMDLISRLSEDVNIIPVGLASTTPAHEAVPQLAGQPQSSSTAMFAVFTSGSTGTPKAAVVSHSNFSSGLRYQSHHFGLSTASRVFDFASYAFDVSVHNVFATFAAGGCLCIPSDQDRLGDFSRVMAEMSVTVAELTPSVARVLDPETVPQLETLILGGEALSVGDVTRWWNKARIVNVYGPAECLASTINSSPSTPEEAINIGMGAGLVTWIVDPDNQESLAPLGCIGELVLEGPLICSGYLNNAEKTAAVFIEGPEWLAQGVEGRPGRSGRMYKTGDLVRYHENGSLSYIGRKDAQVKIRGQRFELREVEHWIQKFIPNIRQVVVEVINTPQGSSGPYLVAFVDKPDQDLCEPDTVAPVQAFAMPTDIKYNLAQHLPSYMIPRLLVNLSKMPMTATGKTDRRRLQEMGASLSTTVLKSLNTSDLLVVGSDEAILASEEPAYALAQKVFSMLPPWQHGDGMVFPKTSTSETDSGNVAFQDVILHSCGLDSVSMMSVVHFISQQFQVRVSLRLLMDPTMSVRKTARYISELQNALLSTSDTACLSSLGVSVSDASKIDMSQSDSSVTVGQTDCFAVYGEHQIDLVARS